MNQEELKNRLLFLETENKFLKAKIRSLEKKIKDKESCICGLRSTNYNQNERLEKMLDNYARKK